MDMDSAIRKQHKQTWSKLKNFAYVHIGRKIMNRNVAKMRNRKVGK